MKFYIWLHDADDLERLDYTQVGVGHEKKKKKNL
jgi:hypothetical protein